VAAAIETWRARAGYKPGYKSRAKPKGRRTPKPVRPAVRFDSLASTQSTVLEVRAEDEPGLAYKIASVIAALGISISFAKISTEKSHALDVFYVSDSNGQKLCPKEMESIESALLEAL
jgi:[protein-PII] uridylyltransferase